MKHHYNTNEKVKEYLNNNQIRTGFYQSDKSTIRYLYDIKLDNEDIFILYANRSSIMSKLKGRSDILELNTLNVKHTNVFDWFVNAKFIGNTLDDFDNNLTKRK